MGKNVSQETSQAGFNMGDCTRLCALIFALIFPPISVLLVRGCGCDFLLNIIKLASLAAHKWLGVAARQTRSTAKVLVCMTGLALSLDEDSVLSQWRTTGKDVEGDDSTSGLLNASAGTSCTT